MPIPNPEKLVTDFKNMRPISLTFNLNKTMERMVFYVIGCRKSETARIPNKRDPDLSAQDSLAMIHKGITSQKTRTPRFLVTIDMTKSFYPLPHGSVLKSAERLHLERKYFTFIKTKREEESGR